MVVVRIIFWTWFAISVCVFLFRGVRWLVRGRGRRLATSGLGLPTESDEAPSVPAAPSPSDAPTARAELRAPSPPPAAPPPRPATPADRPPATPSSAPVTPSGSVASQTIGDLVHGIRMPCDLLPLPGAEPRPASRESIAFTTTGHGSDEVAAALTAELERLGFAVESPRDGELLAARGDDELKVAVHRRAANVSYAGRPAFPTTAPEAVAVELWRD